jgi:hypothetical protein
MTQYRSLISTRRCIVAASAAVCNSNFNAISVRPTGTSRSTPSLRSRRERDGRGGAARGQPSSSHGRPVLNDPRPAYRSGRQQPRDPFRKERDRWFESISLQRRVVRTPVQTSRRPTFKRLVAMDILRGGLVGRPAHEIRKAFDVADILVLCVGAKPADRRALGASTFGC